MIVDLVGFKVLALPSNTNTECLKPVVSYNGGRIPPCGSCCPFRIYQPLKTKDQQRNTVVSPFFLLTEVLGLYLIGWLRSWVHP